VIYKEETVVKDAAALHYFYFVVQGYFEVFKMDPDTLSKNVLGTIRVGQCFGEMSFLTDAPASADVYASDVVVAWVIPHAELREFILTHPEGARLALQISALVAGRLQEGNVRLLGVSTALNSYFGHVARTADLKVTALPQSGDYAEMEIPEQVFNGISIMALGLNDVGLLTPARREMVRQKIESREIDVIPWLELTDRGLRLKIRLKYGNIPSPK
jgi:CRP-like cAMP-binding protein